MGLPLGRPHPAHPYKYNDPSTRDTNTGGIQEGFAALEQFLREGFALSPSIAARDVAHVMQLIHSGVHCPASPQTRISPSCRAMDELLIFAQSGQGSCGRAAGTFQDRLVTELLPARPRLHKASFSPGASCQTMAHTLLPALLPHRNRFIQDFCTNANNCRCQAARRHLRV